MPLSLKQLKEYLLSKGGFTGTHHHNELNDLKNLLNNLYEYRDQSPPSTSSGDNSGVTCNTHIQGNRYHDYKDTLSLQDINEAPITTCSCHSYLDKTCHCVVVEDECFCVSRAACDCVSRATCDCVSRTNCNCVSRTCACQSRHGVECNDVHKPCYCQIRLANSCRCNSRTACACNVRETCLSNDSPCACLTRTICDCDTRTICNCVSRDTCNCHGREWYECDCHGRCSCNAEDRFI